MCSDVGASCFGKSSVIVGWGWLILSLRLVWGGETTHWSAAWKDSPLFTRYLSTGHSVLSVQQLSHSGLQWPSMVLHSRYWGYKTREVLSFSSALSEGGGLFVYVKPQHTPLFSAKNQALWSSMCRQGSTRGPLLRPATLLQRAQLSWSWACFFFNYLIVLVS